MITLRHLGLSLDDLHQAEESGAISLRKHPTESLWIANYTPETAYSRDWNNVTRQCRGLIVDADGKVIARPFPKFFNLGEPEAPITPRGPFIAAEKMDGSLGVLYREPESGRLSIATRGSFTSVQAIHATKVLRERYDNFEPVIGHTYLFEIVFPENRIVVDYGDLDDLVLLDVLSTETGRPARVQGTWTGPRVQQTYYNSPEELPEHEDNAEGHVLYWPNENVRLKVKYARYVEIHRLVTGTNERTIWEALRDNRLDEMLRDIPEEFREWVEKVRFELEHRYFLIEEAARVEFRRIMDIVGWHRFDRDGRKDFAALATKSDANAAVLFRMWDDQPCADLIWKAVKPRGDAPFRVDVDA